MVKEGEERDYLNPETGEIETLTARLDPATSKMGFFYKDSKGVEKLVPYGLGYNTAPFKGTLKRTFAKLQKDPSGKTLAIGDVLISSGGDHYYATPLTEPTQIERIKQDGPEAIVTGEHGSQSYLFKSYQEYQRLRKLSKQLYPDDHAVLGASDYARQKYKKDAVDGLTARLMGNFNKDDETLAMITSRGSYGNETYVKSVVQELVDAWASASNDAASKYTQMAAHTLFDTGLSDNQKQPSYLLQPDATRLSRVRSVLKASHSWTQAHLKISAEIKTIKLYRGLRLRSDAEVKVGDVLDLEDNALASWAWHPESAQQFAMQGISITDKHRRRIMVEAEVDVEDIVSTPATGLGCFNEAEMIIMSRGPRKVKVVKMKEAVMPPTISDDDKI